MTEQLNDHKTDQNDSNSGYTNEYCFTIEGNIGCGKSTFLALLR